MSAAALFLWIIPQGALAQFTYPVGVPEQSEAQSTDASAMPPDPADAPDFVTPGIEPLNIDLPLPSPDPRPTPEPVQPTVKPKATPLPPLPPSEELERGVTCVVTAYYSPLPNQQRYATGSYASELIMEGNGTNGADGTPVFVGMVAASKQYPFGTKVYIPGFGLGEVHDRGGAIKGMCRLDVWLGKGDLGLSRALAWGKRTVTCRIFLPGRPVPGDLRDQAELMQVPKATRQIQGDPIEKPFYSRDLTMGDTDASVEDLEKDLKTLKYFLGTPDRSYDLATAQAVFAFQKSQDIVQSENSYGAGYFGYQTRRALSKWKKGEQKLSPATKPASEQPQLRNLRHVISKGERSDEVRQAQELLGRLGYYLGEKTGIYGEQTRVAILTFQKAQGIVASEGDIGAGKLGPVTAKKLLDTIAVLDEKNRVFERGSKGDPVLRTQEHLVALGRLAPDAITGFFGDQTLASVRRFQLDRRLVGGASDPNYGKLGPRTIAAIERERQQQDLVVVAVKRGDRGEAVKEVQQLLAAVGGYTGPVTGYFGTVTEEAVRAFQKRMRIIVSNDDLGAGMVGPVTKQKLIAIKDERVAVASEDTPGATVKPSEPR